MSIRFVAVGLMLVAGAAEGTSRGQAPRPISSATLVQDTRTVLAAIVKSAALNHRLSRRDDGARGLFRQTGDDLTVYYVRTGATAARQLPTEQAGPAFLLALGIALDDSPLLRQNLLTRTLWRRIESDAERQRRLRVLGQPTLHGRHDLAQHFAVSAALTVTTGAGAAEQAGILKELLDAREGGSGFSFADLAADLAGIAFARRILADPAALATVEQSFTVGDNALSPEGLPEGLSAAAFARQYGSIKDGRFRLMLAYLRRRVDALPGCRPRPDHKLN